MRVSLQFALLLALVATPVCGRGQAAKLPVSTNTNLFEADVPQIEAFYRSHRYTVTQVTRWYLDRIHRYNGISRDIETLDELGALATAARLDREGPGQHPGPLWGIPIVIKANTSIQGMVTTDGWKGYTIPGHELIAPKDAPIVARFRAAAL